MTFDPTSVEVTCVTLPKDHCVQVPWEYINVCGYSDQFSKLPTKGHWPLDDLWPHICWGLMCDSTGSLCPSPMKIHQKYVDTVTRFAKTWTKGHWPLDDLWPPHLLRSHVWLYPRIIVSKSHGNTSMYVYTVINFANSHIHTTYILHTYYIQNQWSHSLSQARQQKLSVVNAAEARFPSCSHDLSIWK